jgi:hypothetical protein
MFEANKRERFETNFSGDVRASGCRFGIIAETINTLDVASAKWPKFF